MSILTSGKSIPQILDELTQLKTHDVAWRSGRLFSYVYPAEPEVEELVKKAYSEFLSENGIDPTAFPSLLQMENDIMDFLRDMLQGDDQTVGHLTTGGTESLLLSVKTARDRAKTEKGITQPEIILPYTVHSSFYKACSYFNVKPVTVPVRADMRADVDAIRNAINPNTILLVASAPSYAFGVIDPIEEIGKLALEFDIPFHVDSCIGGIMLAGMRCAGMKVSPWDFSVPGVTSISLDLHKYGYAAKGCSVLMHRNHAHRKYQYFVCSDWTGYSIVNPTMLSSKSGGPTAGAWAVLNYYGKDGYARLAKETMQCVEQIKQGIISIPELSILSNPDSSLIDFICDDTVNIFELNDELDALGWKVQLQLKSAIAPANIHLTINRSHIGIEEIFIADLKSCIQKVKNGSFPDVEKVVAEETAQGFSSDSLMSIMQRLGLNLHALPERMATVNRVLNALPGVVRAEVLQVFYAGLYSKP